VNVNTGDLTYSGSIDTAEITDGTINAADLAGGFAPGQHDLTAGAATMSKMDIGVSSLAINSNTVRFGYLTAPRTETVTQLVLRCGAVAASATPTVVQFALYSVASNGNLTKLSETANDTALLSAQNTDYAKALGASVPLTAGQRYAIGVLVVTAGTVPQVAATNTLGGTSSTLLPYMATTYAASGSFPSSIVFGTLGIHASVIYAAAIP
jgi:hypothetical protein